MGQQYYRETTAAEWLKEAKEAVQHAIECLGQISGIGVDVRDEIFNTPKSRCRCSQFAVGERIQDLEDAEDEVARLVSYLDQTPWGDLQACNVESFETWRNSAVAEQDRRGAR